MLEIKDVKVAYLEDSVIASKNAFLLVPTIFNSDDERHEAFLEALPRAIKLAKAGGGTGHSSFRKGIRVNFTMKYTQYITKQFQRYRDFIYVTSTSMMHKITSMKFDDCCNKYVSQETVDKMNHLIHQHNLITKVTDDNIKMDFTLRDGEVIHANNRAECLYYQYMTIISECPMGAELYVDISTNYECLATISKQRKGHKLKEDWGVFLDMVRSLPYAKELIPEAFL